MIDLREPLPELFTRSQAMILDFAKLPQNIPEEENIKYFFEDCKRRGLNPRLPKHRQAFNNRMLEATGARYLIGGYGEDRWSMLQDTPAGQQGRTIHMALDIFARNQETVYVPCEGVVIRSDYEAGFGEYGNYIMLAPTDADFYIFLGHLSKHRPKMGQMVKQGEPIASLGDYANDENGGWSRHLHLQILTVLPPEGQTPDGYSTVASFEANAKLYPNPVNYFQGLRHCLNT